jgi:hypothetical protein
MIFPSSTVFVFGVDPERFRPLAFQDKMKTGLSTTSLTEISPASVLAASSEAGEAYNILILSTTKRQIHLLAIDLVKAVDSVNRERYWLNTGYLSRLSM